MGNLIVYTAVACAAMGGVFFAFSSFVMRSLARLPAPQGIAAMQSMNVVAVTPVFMTALFGTAGACVIVAIGAVTAWRGVASFYLLAGSVSYLIGAIGVTIACNVPLNSALAAVEPENGEVIWRRYVRQWTAWNHVRTVSGLIAATLFTIALQL